ncbi:MAG: DUF3106 domain-containing protein [Ramlibacter sp.]|nr:DUF3106 domain-containing protein [Ramlibacter sp.]
MPSPDPAAQSCVALARGAAALVTMAVLALGLAGAPWSSQAQAQTPSVAQPQPQPPSPPQPLVQPEQANAAAPAPPAAGTAPASRAGAPKATASGSKSSNNAKRTTKPLWSELTPLQQQALAPLAGKWDTVSQAQKRKWLALSQNYPGMSGAEQAKLHSRMSEWAALTPQQRTEARLNFGETKQLSPDDKKAKWEAYQALPAEEKRKLAASAPKAPATAAALKPAPPQKLAEVPKPPRVAKTPRIATHPGQVDHHTLLPQPTPRPVPRPADGKVN